MQGGQREVSQVSKVRAHDSQADKGGRKGVVARMGAGEASRSESHMVAS